jgi:hypothetical protein
MDKNKLEELREYVLRYGMGGLKERPIWQIVELIDATLSEPARTEEVERAIEQVKGELDCFAIMSPNTAWSVDDIRRRKNANTILQALRQKPVSQWIPVSERPLKTGRYLVFNNMAKVQELELQDYHAQIELMTYSKHKDKWTTNSIVTYWCELPSAPEGV